MSKKTYTLKSYVAKLATAYETARTKYDKAATDLKTATETYQTKKSSGNYNAQGLKNLSDKYEQTKRECTAKIIEAAEEFNKAYSEVRAEAETIFKDLYEITPAGVDMPMVELLKAGVLSDKDIIKFANEYKSNNNMTMYKMCGNFAEQRGRGRDPELDKLIVAAGQVGQRPDLAVLDTYAYVCQKGLRDNVQLSNGIHNQLQETALAEALESGAAVSIDVDMPW